VKEGSTRKTQSFSFLNAWMKTVLQIKQRAQNIMPCVTDFYSILDSLSRGKLDLSYRAKQTK
jgi:hypothetical protein